MPVLINAICCQSSENCLCFFPVNPLNILGINFLGRRLSLSITMGCTALFSEQWETTEECYAEKEYNQIFF